jgi:hypothetical protein
VTVTRSISGCRASFSGSENANGISKCLAVASADSCRVVHTAAISKSGSAHSAGIWAIDANPRFGLNPTIPTRILLLVAIAFLLIDTTTGSSAQSPA